MSIREKIIGSFEEKKEWKALQVRVLCLPKEYQNAYKSIQKYIHASGSCPEEWDNYLRIFSGLVDLLEEGSLDNRKITEILGDDVAEFCEELTKDEKSWKDKYRNKLNKKIQNL